MLFVFSASNKMSNLNRSLVLLATLVYEKNEGADEPSCYKKLREELVREVERLRLELAEYKRKEMLWMSRWQE